MHDMSWCKEKKNQTKPVYLFLGAGISFTSGIPRASELTKKAIHNFIEKEEERTKLEDPNSSFGIQDFADRMQREAASERIRFKEFIATNLYSQSRIVSTEYRMLSFLIKHRIISAIYTTNQDVCLERALELQGISYNRFVYDKDIKHIDLTERLSGSVDIYKLCGDVHRPVSMCFSTSELEDAADSVLFERLLERFDQNCYIIFMGYSACEDPIGRRLRAKALDRHGKRMAQVYCVDCWITDKHRQLCSGIGDHIIASNAEEYLKNCIRHMRPRLSVKQAVFNKGDFGGVQTYAYSLMVICKDLPIDYSCYATQDFYREEAEGAKDELFGFEYLMASSKAETVKALSGHDVDVLHAHNFVSAYTAQALDIPCVLTSHSLESKEMEFGRRDSQDIDSYESDIEKYQDEYYNKISTVLTLSESHKQELPRGVRHYAVKTKAPFIHPDTLNVNTRAPSMEKRSDLIKKNRVSSIMEGNDSCFEVDKPTIAFFGRPSKRKGLSVFKMAVEELYKQIGNSFQVLYVGPTPEGKDDTVSTTMEKEPSGTSNSSKYQEVQKISRELQQCMYRAQENISTSSKKSIVDDFADHQRSMYDYYLACDVVIIPSAYEPFGYVALEAMACERAVIATKVGGLQELLADGRGTLIDPEGLKESQLAQKIAEACKHLLDHQDDRLRRVKKAKQWVDSEYSEEEMGALAEQIYQSYLSSVIRGRNMNGQYSGIVDAKLGKGLKDISNWHPLLIGAAKIYREILEELKAGNDPKAEDYNLFWDVAYWLKANKPLCREINIMPITELAQLITEVERAIPKNSQ